MKAKIWTLVFTVILFAAVSGCGKTAAQETEITQQASLEAADKAFCEAGAAQAESFFKTGAALCPVLHSYGPYPSYYLDDGAPVLSMQDFCGWSKPATAALLRPASSAIRCRSGI